MTLHEFSNKMWRWIYFAIRIVFHDAEQCFLSKCTQMMYIAFFFIIFYLLNWVTKYKNYFASYLILFMISVLPEFLIVINLDWSISETCRFSSKPTVKVPTKSIVRRNRASNRVHNPRADFSESQDKVLSSNSFRIANINGISSLYTWRINSQGLS